VKRRVKWLLYKMRLVRYVKVEVYLRSGQTVKFKCKEWEAKGSAPLSGDNGLQSYSFKGIKDNTIWFNIQEIVAIKGES
jgi:hypothetical protein